MDAHIADAHERSSRKEATGCDRSQLAFEMCDKSDTEKLHAHALLAQQVDMSSQISSRCSA